ncbi:acyltransferase-domain-containing protein [Anaeromyces robustus]|uniref:1-acyl-sn-glycerol-3-phosphate acyltransferase n=1 Tax=Anaeromyces robustus TaxID=1754192 RepID=A0A1Y1WP33_9FUNG|nr:acyltransferase-domain-containing protein [Anaeromyces robustus]|eukprot:ORX75283.1 acyltransferase-domain-containing protein [Anaeromyces robustus]
MSLLLIFSIIIAILAVAYLTNIRVKYYIKCVVFIFNFLFVSLGSVIIILISKLTPYPQDGSVIRPVFSKYWQIISGFDSIEIEGDEYLDADGKGTRPCVFMYNHQSSLDMLMICSFMPKKCILLCKKSLKKYPLLGQYLQITGAYFIDRKNSASAIDTMKEAAQYIKKNKLAVSIAPEGTRSNFKTPDLLPFKKGGFHLAIQAQCPIVPIVIPNYPTAGVYDASKFNYNGGKLKIKVLPPIPVDGLNADDVNDLVEKVRNQMLDTIKELSEENRLMNLPKKSE